MRRFRCMSTLVPLDEEGYSRSARQHLTGGNRMFPQRLSFDPEGAMTYRTEHVEHMSISGVQVKLSLVLRRGRLELTDRDGEYILKPRPRQEGLAFEGDLPANEHVTMQLASQVFGIETAANACIRFRNGELAYIVRRFDRRKGRKIPQEDFCQLTRRSPEADGRNFKYQGSYEELGRVLRTFCPAHAIEAEKLFALVAFNFVVGNGDAHLKNFSLYESDFGDHVLTPAYDLLCTRLHLPDESSMALELFDDDVETPSFTLNGFHTGECFLRLSRTYGLRPHRAQAILDMFAERRDRVHDLVGRSFLTPGARTLYLRHFDDRLRAIAIRHA